MSLSHPYYAHPSCHIHHFYCICSHSTSDHIKQSIIIISPLPQQYPCTASIAYHTPIRQITQQHLAIRNLRAATSPFHRLHNNNTLLETTDTIPCPHYISDDLAPASHVHAFLHHTNVLLHTQMHRCTDMDNVPSINNKV